MHFTKVQISELMRKHAEKENGLHDLMEIMLESMMVAERGEFLRDNPDNKGNGYRPGRTYGLGKRLEFRMPPRPLRQLPSADSRHTARPGRGVRPTGRSALHQRAYAGTGR